MARDELLKEGADESDDEETSEEDIVKLKRDCEDNDTDPFSDGVSNPGDTMLSAASSSQVGPRLPLKTGPHESQSSFRRASSSATIANSQTSES